LVYYVPVKNKLMLGVMHMISSIPPELKQSSLFCCWRYETRNGSKTKLPYNPITGRSAKSNDPSTFTEFQTAVSATGYDGIGIGIFNGICAVDLDHCVTDSGCFKEPAGEIVELLHSYTEYSPSGDGLHILFSAENFQYDTNRYYIMNHDAGIEVYVAGATNKYVTVTGNRANTYAFGERSRELTTLLERFMKRPEQQISNVKMSGENVVNGGNAALSDGAVLRRMVNSKTTCSVSRLYDGDITGYPSHSEADLALCSHLAFWTGRNPQQIDRLFRASGLMRDKWDRKQSGSTYGALTIQKAISLCHDVYHPSASPQIAPAIPPPSPKEPIPPDNDLFQPFVPLQIESCQLPAFPLEALPQPIQDYVEAIAVHSQTSIDMAASISLGVLAIALQRKFEIMGKSGYGEPLNLYLVIIASPGERKSAVMRDMTSVISRFEQEKAEAQKQAIKDNHSARASLQRKIKRLEHRLEKSEDIELEGELRDAEAQLEDLPELKPTRYYADDCTPEALTSLLADYKGVFSVLSTEGGIFDILSGRYSKKPNLDTWLKGHCGDDIVVDRKGRPQEHIHHPTLSAVLTVQPSVLANIMGNATMEGRGLLDRFLYCSPPSRVGHRIFESPAISDEVRLPYEALIFSLMALPLPEEPQHLTLSSNASMLFSDFFLENEHYLLQKGKAIPGWAGKYPGTVLRIAGLLHAAEHPTEFVVSSKTIHRAIAIGRYFLAQAEFAYTQIANDQAIEKGLLLASTLLDVGKDPIRHYELFHACRGKFFKEAHDIDSTLELLEEHGYIRLIQPDSTGKPGRKPSMQIIVNPLFRQPD
jgi:hypothetical protein